VPSAGHFGGDAWLKLHEAHVKTVQANKGPVDVLLVGDRITIQWGESWKKHFPKLKAGNVIGSTDDIGLRVADQPQSVKNLHATILTALGINPHELFFEHAGRQERLTRVAQSWKTIPGVICRRCSLRGDYGRAEKPARRGQGTGRQTRGQLGLRALSRHARDARTQQPKSFRDHDVLPAEGLSLLPALCGNGSLPSGRVLYWERMGNEAVRQGSWKLVRAYGAVTEDGNITSTGPRTGEWELYDTTTDPGETTNLAAQQPDRVKSMIELHATWAKRVGVVPREEIVKVAQTKQVRSFSE
jgi:hypothetical protein